RADARSPRRLALRGAGRAPVARRLVAQRRPRPAQCAGVVAFRLPTRLRRAAVEHLLDRQLWDAPLPSGDAADFLGAAVDDAGGDAGDAHALGLGLFVEGRRQAVELEAHLRAGERFGEAQDARHHLLAVRAPVAEEDAHADRFGRLAQRAHQRRRWAVLLGAEGVARIVVDEVLAGVEAEQVRLLLEPRRLALDG